MKKTKKLVAKRTEGSHGGYRPGAGRKGKPDPENWGRVTCMLRLDTIQALRDGAGAPNFGEFLQWHLDRNKLPSYEVYQAILNHKPIWTGTGKRRQQVLYGGNPYGREIDSPITPRQERELRRKRIREQALAALPKDATFAEKLAASMKAQMEDEKAQKEQEAARRAAIKAAARRNDGDGREA